MRDGGTRGRGESSGSEPLCGAAGGRSAEERETEAKRNPMLGHRINASSVMEPSFSLRDGRILQTKGSLVNFPQWSFRPRSLQALSAFPRQCLRLLRGFLSHLPFQCWHADSAAQIQTRIYIISPSASQAFRLILGLNIIGSHIFRFCLELYHQYHWSLQLANSRLQNFLASTVMSSLSFHFFSFKEIRKTNIFSISDRICGSNYNEEQPILWKKLCRQYQKGSQYDDTK
nr:uncharacterized protein LOC127484266 [Oryctolagus cuniculus]